MLLNPAFLGFADDMQGGVRQHGVNQHSKPKRKPAATIRSGCCHDPILQSAENQRKKHLRVGRRHPGPGELQSPGSGSFFGEKIFGCRGIVGRKHVPDPFLQDFAILATPGRAIS